MGIFGICNALSSMAAGRISDHIGRLPLLLVGSIVHLIGRFALSLPPEKPQTQFQIFKINKIKCNKIK